MMFIANIKMASDNIRGARFRSFLTMLGVVIGVASVVIIVSLGQGVRNQVLSQISLYGGDIITIRPGNTSNSTGAKLAKFTSSTSTGNSTLSSKDVEEIKKIPGVIGVSESAIITGVASTSENPNYYEGKIIATNPETPVVLSQKIEFGEFFGEKDLTRTTAVIGSNIAADLFKQREPIGRILTIRGQEFTVRGVLAATPSNPFKLGDDSNNLIYIPMGAGKLINESSLQISEINAKVDSSKKIAEVSKDIEAALLKKHSEQKDFTIITQDDYLKTANQVFIILTSFVAAIAGISLFVGGIGIMNIMLVSVSERTREIGVRKAIGATNNQIMSQFITESIVISFFGGFMGIAISLLATFILRVTTDFKPVLSVPTILLATGVSVAVGIIFGIAPAYKASRKDPIESLRHE